jgi:hypothetical protein
MDTLIGSSVCILGLLVVVVVPLVVSVILLMRMRIKAGCAVLVIYPALVVGLIWFAGVTLLLVLVSPLVLGGILCARKQVKAGSLILILYLPLICAVFIFGRSEKRSVTGHILRWYEGEDGSHQDVDDLAEDAKKTVDPSALQSWAVAVLQKAGTNSYVDIPREEVPASISNLTYGVDGHFEDATCLPAEPASTQDRSVLIEWGSVMGHWGMRVGPPTFRIRPSPHDNYYFEWKPGIYFWCETR